MANTIARARGYTKEGTSRASEATRPGSGSAWAAANTWRTFASVRTRADGSGEFELRRDGVTLHLFEWEKENV